MRRRRHRRKLRGAAKPRKQSYRFPSLPESFHSRVWGICRWCGNPIIREDGTPNTKRLWHDNCVHEYKFIHHPSYTKRIVKKRDKGRCADCGTVCRLKSEWQLDHNKPLIEAKGDLWYWSMENLVTRCVKCHKIKTASENAVRRAIKAAAKKKRK